MNEGDKILTSSLENELEFNKARILNLLLFSTVQYEIINKNADTIDVKYTVTELFYWITKPLFSLADRNFNVWWVEQNHMLNRTNLGLELTRLNFRGRNEEIICILQVGYNKHFSLSYKIPYIDKNLKHGIGLKASYTTSREINYQTAENKLLFYKNQQYPYKYLQAKINYTYRHKYAAIHELQLSYNLYSITNGLFEKNANFLANKLKLNFFELSYIHNYNNTNVRLYPTEGIETKTILSKKGLGLDKDINRFEIYNYTAIYKPIWKGLSSSFVFRGKYTTPNQQPYIFNRALGFNNEYVRGYEYYVIDGSRYAVLRGNLRYKIIDRVIKQNVIKFMQFIPFKTYFKAYNDIGYVYNFEPQNSFLNNKFLSGRGIGLDVIISYYIKLRLEYSINHLNQNALFLHTTKE